MVVVAVIAVVCVFVFGGKSQEPSGSVTNSTGTASSADGTTAKFDIEEVINNITIDGKPYKWFSSLNDLGPDWDWAEYGGPSVMWPGTEAAAVVEYKGEHIFTVSLCNYDENSERDAMFFGMRVTDSSSSSYDDLISVDGLMVGDSKKDVLKELGEPTRCDQDFIIILLKKNSNSLLYLSKMKK